MPKSGMTRALLLLTLCTALGLGADVRAPEAAEGFGAYPLGLLAVVLLQVRPAQLRWVAPFAALVTGLALWWTGQSVVESIAYSLGAVVAAVLALAILRAHAGPLKLRSESDLLRIIVAAVAGALVVGLATFVAGSVTEVEDLRSLTGGSLINEAASLLLWLPLAMDRLRVPSLAGNLERWVQWILVLTVTVVVFGAIYTPSFAYLVLAVMGWAGLRFALLETLLQLIVVRLIAMTFTAHGMGPFSETGHRTNLPPDLEIAFVQLFLITCSIAVVALSLSSTRARVDSRKQALARADAVADSKLSVVVEELEAERSALEELREVDRVKDAFVSNVSHELRTPITNIIGYTELLDDGDYGQLTPLQNGAMERIGENGRRLLSLIDDLLTLSRLRSVDMELSTTPVDLVAMVRSAERIIAPRVHAAGLSLEMDLGDRPVVVRGDGEKLERVMLNLMSNAVKFTPQPGQVTVGLRQVDSRAVLSVSDTGHGIPAEDLGKLFSQFFRTSLAQERQIQGTGLGLSIVRAIVESHGGHIEVESEVDAGTTFSVHLPL
ncbi:sensor histidine kinase [Nocardioides houyundeii]|uniref:sensor histidine kinase n=1 Tax=Nocardioides houyundeii TaxID=2045452 RepID=UPI0013B3BA50|nr:ATP-binding protein [Nocardioides houyundeii]